MKRRELLIIIFCIVVFILGMYFLSIDSHHFLEGFKPINNPLDCPNILLQEGNKIFLYNNKKAKIPGVNPIQFNTLEEYTEFMEWQKSQNIRCPALYLQKSFDAQGLETYQSQTPIYQVQPDSLNPYNDPNAVNPSLLLDANHSNDSTVKYNTNSMPGYDPSSFYVGKTTPLDEMDDSSLLYKNNDDAMSDNWSHTPYDISGNNV